MPHGPDDVQVERLACPSTPRYPPSTASLSCRQDRGGGRPRATEPAKSRGGGPRDLSGGRRVASTVRGIDAGFACWSGQGASTRPEGRGAPQNHFRFRLRPGLPQPGHARRIRPTRRVARTRVRAALDRRADRCDTQTRRRASRADVLRGARAAYGRPRHFARRRVRLRNGRCVPL
jgi:hypothetical protein